LERLKTLIFIVLMFAPFRAAAVESAEDTGFLLYSSFTGSLSNSLGYVTKLDTTVGYAFNSHFTLDGGVPFYFVRPTDQTAKESHTPGADGLGNIYLEGRLRFDPKWFTFTTTLTGTLPTGDEQKGFSTGTPTIDLNNHIERTFGHLTPFAEFGVANTVSDTRFFVRPFSSHGLVSHYEAGGMVTFWRSIVGGASVYAVIPSGAQTVVSRIPNPEIGAPPPVLNRNSPPPVRRRVLLIGGTNAEELTRDNGFSLWGQYSPKPYVDLLLGYTRSVEYDLNSISFGIGFNLASVIKKYNH